MASPISLKILVPNYIKKYLISQSENKSEPIIFHRKHNFNRLLINLVSNRKDILDIKPKKDDDSNNSIVKIKLPFNEFKDVYFYNKISESNMIRFRNEIKLFFLYDYSLFIRRKHLEGQQRKIATEQFLKMLNINEDELKYESLYRKFTRYMNKNKLIL